MGYKPKILLLAIATFLIGFYILSIQHKISSTQNELLSISTNVSNLQEQINQQESFFLGANNGMQGDGTFDVLGNGTSTFLYGIEISLLGNNVAIGGSSTTTLRGDSASSTFSNGIVLTEGCFIDHTGSCLTSGAAGANTALSNLSSVAINTSLLSDANNTDDLGVYGTAWKDIYSSGTIYGGGASFTSDVSGIAFNELEDLDGSINLALGDNNIQFSAGGTGEFDFVFQGSTGGHKFDILHNAGDLPEETHLLHIEDAANDADVLLLHLEHSATSPELFRINGSNGTINWYDVSAFDIGNNGSTSTIRFGATGAATTTWASDFAVLGTLSAEDGSTTTTIRENSLTLGQTSGFDQGVFNIDSSGNINASGTLNSLPINTFYPAFTYNTSTPWTGTSTIPLGVAYDAETWDNVKCFTDTGTLNVAFNDGTNLMNSLNASTTVGTFTLSSNNTFTSSEKRYVDIGNPASSPTSISCTVKKTINP